MVVLLALNAAYASGALAPCRDLVSEPTFLLPERQAKSIKISSSPFPWEHAVE